MAEEFLQEIKEAKHTDDPHDSANKESIDGYITQPKVGTGAHIWKRARYWSRAWGWYDANSTTSYARYAESQGAVFNNTGSYNDITSFKIIDNNLTSNTFSGTYRVLRIGAT